MTILAATDFSDRSATAVRQAARLAADRHDELVLLHSFQAAADLPPEVRAMDNFEEMRADWIRGGEEKLDDFLTERVPEADRPDEVTYHVDLDAADESICQLLESESFALAVLGATGQHWLARTFLGSTSEAVARRSQTPILVVPESGRVGAYEHVVAPVDFTRCSRRSFEEAVSMARAYDANLTILHAHRPPVAETDHLPSDFPDEALQTIEDRSKNRLQSFLDDFDLDAIGWQTRLATGAPDDAVVETVEDVDGDLVVMGTHGRRGFERFFLGSTATKVLRRMPCSTMTVRSTEEDPDTP